MQAKLKILVVDDNAENRALAQAALEVESGERVLTRTGRGLGLAFCKLAIEAHVSSGSKTENLGPCFA